MNDKTIDELFELEIVTDNPLFEGFAMEPGPSVLGRENQRDDISPGFDASTSAHSWSAPRLAALWTPPKVVGRVASYQDFPGVDMVLPAFSKRACEALHDLLEPNGELLPVNSDAGEYYVYNITTFLDAFDRSKAKATYFTDEPSIAVNIDYFAFHEEKLTGAPIFRIFEEAVLTIVTREFVTRVHEHGLNGFHFVKIWPFPEGVNWRTEAKKLDQQQAAENASPDLRRNTLVILLSCQGKKPNAKETRVFKRYEDELDAQLAMPALDAPYFGKYEGRDSVPGEIRLFLSCPDANRLARKLYPWLKELKWPGGVSVMKRYGEMRDPDAKEEVLALSPK